MVSDFLFEHVQVVLYIAGHNNIKLPSAASTSMYVQSCIMRNRCRAAFLSILNIDGFIIKGLGHEIELKCWTNNNIALGPNKDFYLFF